MKKRIAILITLALAALCAAALANGVDIGTTFEDAKLRAIITEEFDTNKDGELNKAEIAAATYLDCSDKGITSLSGIGELTELTSLNCGENPLNGVLDLRGNIKLSELRCYDAGITGIQGLSSLTELTSLSCSKNPLGSLEVSNNTKLTNLFCGRCGLSSLNVNQNTQLKFIDCMWNNIGSLNVSMCTQLEEFTCSNNVVLSSLTLGTLPQLKELHCENNSLPSLQIPGSPKLEVLSCSTNKLKELDVTGFENLFELACRNNQLTGLDLSKNTKLEEIDICSNKLTKLDLSANALLTKLTCSANRLTELNLSGKNKLYYLWVEGNSIKTLDVRPCPQLCDLVDGMRPEQRDDFYQWGTYNSKNPGLIIGLNTMVRTNTGVFNKKVTKITISPAKVTLVRTAKNLKPTKTLKATVMPKDASNRLVVWESSKPKVVKVDAKTGKITGLKVGTATITCRAKDGSGVKATCKVTVKDQLVTGIKLNKTKADLKVGKSLKLKATITPKDAVNRNVTWTSSNKKVATVDKNGKVTAKKAGKVKITCTAQDGSRTKAVCTITVK